jgi:Ca2+-binding RTX toxin-like protein
MSMAHEIKAFDINSGDVQFLFDQANFRTLKVVGYDATGTPIYGWVDGNDPFAPVALTEAQAAGGATIQIGGNTIHTLGAVGTFDPLDPAFNKYDGARDYEGLRNVSGQFNNLVGGQNSWGSSNEQFLRLTNGDYAHYSQENLAANAAAGGALDPTTHKNPYTGVAFSGVTNGVTTQADYSDPTKAVVDYTPRMITQTISSQAALDRLNVSTDTTTGTRLDFDPVTGQLTQQAYTENFIENTNSYAADPSYSGWFVLFGQFFDHGLDFIAKPNTNALIEIPLATDDPLYGTIGPDGQKVTSIKIARATVSNLAAAGADGKFGTADDIKDPGADKIYHTADDVLGPTSAQYGNSDSPYIDQNQTYGSSEQITQLLREWIPDPNHPGQFIAGAALLDGHTVKDAYLSTVFSDRGAPSATTGGQGLTDRTLPTLDELRAALTATGRDDLTWEDIANYRLRDAQGHVMDVDLATAGVQTAGSGQAIMLDMNPRFDAIRLNPNDGDATTTWDVAITSKVNAAIATLNGSLPPGATLSMVNGALTLHVPAGMMGPGAPAMDLTGVGAMSFWVNPVDNSIMQKMMGSSADMSAAVHAAAGEIMLASIGDHYVAGDGRANENFGLTTVHHVFHEDHNYQTANLEAQILATGDATHRWQVKVANSGAPTATSGDISTADQSYTGVNYHFQNLKWDAAVGSYTATITNILDAKGAVVTSGANPLSIDGVYVDKTGHISWNQDMMFNAAKLVVEMEYQHVAIDQYARFVTPDLPEFVSYDASINADISLEYAQAAFRFGHSQLRDTIDTIETQSQTTGAFDVTGQITKYALQAAFLNPGAFADAGPGAIALGMSHQVGNETDEFVTPALQQNLLNQPLDLAAINIARARDLGVPTLNEVRKQLYDAIVAERNNPDTLSSQPHAKIQLDLLSPYNSWNEFGGSMIHPESLVNFIAAYSFDGDVAKAEAMVGLDDGSITEGSAAAMGFTAQRAYDFMAGALDSTGHFKEAGADGFNSIDLWIGGLAESHVLGGILGPTFNAIFEDQMERLMDGDRMYYLYRLFLALPEITNLNESITNEQFKDIVERTTGVQHLNGDIMLYADSYIELGNKAVADAKTEHKYGDIVDHLHATGELAATQGVYSSGGAGTGGNGQLITIQNPEHPGTYLTYVRDLRPDSPDINSNDNPTYGYNSHEVLSGTAFNDYLDAGDGDDTIYGGAGNDILIGNGGSDHIYGEAGDDVIYGAGGKAGADVIDFLDGGDGNDYIYGGENAGATEILIGGNGDDHLYSESGIDEIYGGNGNDYIDGGGDTDLLFGDAGNDEMHGGDGPDTMNGGSGDDLMSGGSGTDKLAGEEGDDILYGGQGGGVAQGDSDELWGGDANNTVDDGFDIAAYSDSSIKLDVAADLNNVGIAPGSTGVAPEPYNNMYVGIEGIIGSKFDDAFAKTAAGGTNPAGAGLIGDAGDNWLIGGSGNDVIDARAGNDVIVGDSIKLAALDGFLGTQTGFSKHFVDLLATRPDFVLGDGGSDGAADKATFSGKLAEYTLVALDASGQVVASPRAHWSDVFAIKVTDNGGLAADGTARVSDGVDLVVGVEQFAFADQTIDPRAFFDAAPTLDLHHVVQTQNLTVASDNFDAIFNLGNGYARGSGWASNWAESNDTASGNAYSGGQIQVAFSGLNSGSLRFGGGDGASIQRAVDLSGKTSATIGFSVNEANFASGETVKVWFAADGVNFVLEKTFDGTTNNGGGQSFVVNAPAAGFSTSALLKFEVSGVASVNGSGAHTVTVDNVSVTTSVTADQFAGNNFSTTYVEQAVGAAIASTPSITDPDDSTIASATIHLRDAVAGDLLHVSLAGLTGIIATGDGTGTIVLTGVASQAAYQQALSQITFANPTNNNPTNADRHIDVTVSDGLKDSAVATTTVHVTPVDDPAVLAADNVITNIGTGTTTAANIVIPDWALLANDTDPDSALAIASIGGATGLTISGQGLGHSGGQVTLRDTSPDGGSFTYHVNGASPDAKVTVSEDTVGALDGTANNDIIVGKAAGSTILAGAGNDIVFVGTGHDDISGGAGSDTFVFRSVAEAGNNGTRDVIQDFATLASAGVVHDTLDMSGIDANTGQFGSQAFTWDTVALTGTSGAVARGHLGYYYQTINGVEHTILTGNTSSNAASHDVQVDLLGHLTFTTSGPNQDMIL